MRRVAIAPLLVLALSPAHAQVIGPIPVAGTAYTLAAGPGNQLDPSVDGSRVVYTYRVGTGSDRHAKTHIIDLTTGVTTVLAADDDFIDTLPYISGDYVVFSRHSRTSSTLPIAFVNLSDPSLTITELAPAVGTRRTPWSVAGDTVASSKRPAPSITRTYASRASRTPSRQRSA